MRRVIKGRLYDTDSARPIGTNDNNITLYRTKSSQFFIANSLTIVPMTQEEASAWSILYLDGDCTAPPKKIDMATITISLTAAERQQLLDLAQQAGQTVSAYIRAKCLA